MTDMNKTIKEASDDELRQILYRLRSEKEAQTLIRELRLDAMNSQQRREYYENGNLEGVSTETPINSLYHFGILGMRWGVRRSKSELARNSRRVDISSDEDKKMKIQKKKIREMSTSELNEVTKRLELEKKYKTLNAEQMSKGKRLLNKFINDTTNAAMTNASNYLGKKIFDTAINATKKK